MRRLPRYAFEWRRNRLSGLCRGWLTGIRWWLAYRLHLFTREWLVDGLRWFAIWVPKWLLRWLLLHLLCLLYRRV